MAKPKKKKEIVFLVCEESGDRNYTLLKKPGTPKLELSKYCARLPTRTSLLILVCGSRSVGPTLSARLCRPDSVGHSPRYGLRPARAGSQSGSLALICLPLRSARMVARLSQSSAAPVYLAVVVMPASVCQCGHASAGMPVRACQGGHCAAGVSNSSSWRRV